MREILPVADARDVRRYARRLAKTYPRDLYSSLALHALAAIAGLAAPRLLGDLVEDVEQGTTTGQIDTVALVLAVFLGAQTILTRFARYLSFKLGEKVLADLREDFVQNALALPIGTVERAGTGDLLTRTSRDVDALGWSVRFAVPETLIAIVTAFFTIAAVLLVGWWVAIPLVLGVPILWAGTRWYLARAKAGYLRESASYAEINSTLAETVEGARTVDALRLAERRRQRIDDDIHESFLAEKYTLFLRTVWFPIVETLSLIHI